MKKNEALPQGWVRARLEDVCIIRDSERVPVSSKDRVRRVAGKGRGDVYRYYGATGQVGWIDGFLFDGTHVLLGEDGAPFFHPAKAKAYIVKGKYWVNNHAHVLQPLVDPAFLCHYLNHLDYRPYVTGTTRLKLNQKAMRAIPVPVPSSLEQRAIADKIDDLFSELDRGVELLKSVGRELAGYRKAALKAAVEGRLSEVWCDSNHDADSSGLTEKNTQATRGQTTFRLRSSVRERHATGFYPVPEGWSWVKTQEVGDVRLGRQRAPKYQNGNHMRPYLRVANVLEDRIDVSDVLSMNFEPDEFEVYRLQYGDILLNEGQSLELVGRPAMYRNELPDACFQNTLVRFRPSERVIPEFALIVFLAYLHTGRFQAIAKYTVNIAHLGAKRLAELPFPLPPIEEQRRIVEEIDRRWRTLDMIKGAVERSLHQANLLQKSILERAFEGRLLNALEASAFRWP